MHYSILVIVMFSALFTGCFLVPQDRLAVFDNSYPLATAPDISWAVVTDPFASYRSGTSWQSDVTGYCRKGEILQVTGKTTIASGGVQSSWYHFAQGWLPSSSVTVYSNRLKAAAASEELKN